MTTGVKCSTVTVAHALLLAGEGAVEIGGSKKAVVAEGKKKSGVELDI